MTEELLGWKQLDGGEAKDYPPEAYLALRVCRAAAEEVGVSGWHFGLCGDEEGNLQRWGLTVDDIILSFNDDWEHARKAIGMGLAAAGDTVPLGMACSKCWHAMWSGCDGVSPHDVAMGKDRPCGRHQ